MSRIFCFVVVLMFPAILAMSEPVQAQDDLNTRANKLIRAGQAASVVPLLEQALAAEPERADLHFLLGIVHFRMGEDASAVQSFRRALELDPQHVRARYNLGAAYFRQEKWDDAVRVFLALPEVAPEMAAAAYLNAGLARIKQGKRDAAKSLFEQAIASDPDSKSADSAQDMLDMLRGKPAASAPPVVRVDAKSRKWSDNLSLKVSFGREFDTNVFASPDDQAVSRASDWRTTAKARVIQQNRLTSRFRLTSGYSFFGRWYNSRNQYNYLSHQLFINLKNRGKGLRPTFEYSYGFDQLGRDDYLTHHNFGVGLTLYRRAGRVFSVKAGLSVDRAPENKYDHLSGTSARLAATGSLSKVGGGKLSGQVTARYLDKKDRVSGADFFSYSYTSLEPAVQWIRRFWWKTRLSLMGRYQLRSYHDADVWTGPPSGSKTRRDHRVTATVKVSRQVFRKIRADVVWQSQITRSNIGDDPNDYINRDYERNLYGLWLHAEW